MTATPTEIEYFLEIFKTQHVSRAALRLGISQPTLTQSLLKLEEKLQVKLFYRTKNGVVPTPAGTAFYEKGHQLLDLWKQVSTDLSAQKNTLSRRFRVGCHPSVGAYTIPPLLQALSRAAPQIELDLHHDFSRKITEAVVAYKIDLGFIVNPVRHPDLVLKRLCFDRVSFWRSRLHPHPKQRLFADVELLQVQDLLGKVNTKRFAGWSLIRSSSLELIRTLTLSGEGVGVLPERVALADNAGLVPYDDCLPWRKDEMYLAYRKEVLADAAGKELVNLAAHLLDAI